MEVLNKMKQLGVSDKDLTKYEGMIDKVFETDDLDERMDIVEDIITDIELSYDDDVSDEIEMDLKDLTLM